MKRQMRLVTVLLAALLVAVGVSSLVVGNRTQAQAGRKSAEKQKKNPNASGNPEEQQRREDEKKVDKTIPPGTVSVSTDLVNVEAVVYNKKNGAIIQGLKKENFEIYEDGIKQEVENFSTPDA